MVDSIKPKVRTIDDYQPGELNPELINPKNAAKDSIQNKWRQSDLDVVSHLLGYSEKAQEEKLGTKILKGIVLEIITKKKEDLAVTTTDADEPQNRWQIRVFLPFLCIPLPSNYQKQPLPPEDQAKMNMHHIFTAANSDLPLPQIGQRVRVQYPSGKIDNRRGICLGAVEWGEQRVLGSVPKKVQENFQGDRVIGMNNLNSEEDIDDWPKMV